MIFISYRRSDTQQAAGRLRERLADEYGAENIYLDICDIATGARFRQAIDDALARSDVALVLIGPRWADAQNALRLSDPADVVRQEIESALARGITTVPLLIDQAPLPGAGQLPASLHPLLAFNAASVESGIDFDLGVTRLTKRIDEISAVAAERRAAVAFESGAWQRLNGPSVEAVVALAHDRGTPRRIYALALLARRVLRSDENLERWISHATLPGDASPRCLAVCGQGRRTILWVGAAHHLFQYRQADFQWRDTAYFAKLGERNVRWIAVNPADEAHILVGTGQYRSGTSMGAATAGAFGGAGLEGMGEANWVDDVMHGDLHGSRDGGTTWRTGPFRNVNRVAFADGNARVVHVATADDGLFVSTNATASFTRSPGTEQHTLWSMAVSPHDPSRVLLGNQGRGVLVSFDAGTSWTHPPALSKASVLCAAFSSSDPAVLLVGTDEGAFMSHDGGRTFAASNQGLVHKRALAALSLGAEGFLIATDGGGIYARAKSAHDWRQVHRGVMRAGIGALAFDADDVLYVGAGGTLCRTEDFGRSFQPLHHTLETIRAICVFGSSATPGDESAVRWNRSNVCLVGTERGCIERSGDYGATWERVFDRFDGPVRKIARAAALPGTTYAVVAGRELHVSADEGRTWTALGVSRYGPVTFALPEDRSGSILLGTMQHGVLESDDAGATWRALAGGLPAKPVLSLHVEFVRGLRSVLAGLQQGGVWRYVEGAASWLQGRTRLRGESVNDIAVRGKQVLVATDTGVFRSVDGGITWRRWSDGLSDVEQVNRLAASRDGQTLFCGEVGGLYARLASSGRSATLR